MPEFAIANSVTEIGKSAFENCTALTSVKLPLGIRTVPERLFAGCTGLKTATMTTLVTSIGEEAFYGCTALTELRMPSSIERIGARAFDGCDAVRLFIGQRDMKDFYTLLVTRLTAYQQISKAPAAVLSAYLKKNSSGG